MNTQDGTTSINLLKPQEYYSSIHSMYIAYSCFAKKLSSVIDDLKKIKHTCI